MEKIIRTLNTGLLVLTALGNSVIVQAFSTINDQVTRYLPNVTSPQVSFTALVFMILHPFISVPVNYMLDRYPLKLGISINCVMVCIGLALRLLILHGFGFVIAGNLLVAIGNAFVMNCPAKYSAIWYTPQKRLLITSLIIFANCISGAVGAFLSPFIVKSSATLQQGQNQLQRLMMIHAISIGSIMIANLIFFRGSPNQYCQKLTQSSPAKQPYIQTLKSLLTTKSFLLSLICMITFISVLNSILTNIELLIFPFNLTGKDAGIASMFGVVFGLLGSVVFSIVISRTKKFKKIILALYIGTIMGLLLIGFAVLLQSAYFYWISVAIFGFVAFPTISAVIEYTCQALYPVGQATVTGILLAGGQIASFFVGLLQTVILSAKTKTNCYYVQFLNIGILLICCITFSFTTQQLKRLENHLKRDESLIESQASQNQQDRMKTQNRTQ